MKIYNKVILLPNLDAVCILLNNNKNEGLYQCKCMYENRIAIQYYWNNKDKTQNTIRVWRTWSLFDYWYNDFQYMAKNFIGALDYTIQEDYIKIDYININDEEKKHMFHLNLDENEAQDLIKAFIQFLKIIAKKEKKNKIVLDVHSNCRIFYKYYYNEGFNITNRQCKNNPFWMETEIIL